VGLGDSDFQIMAICNSKSFIKYNSDFPFSWVDSYRVVM